MPEVSLRLFGPARTAAGTASASLVAGTVGEVLEQAVERYGEALASLLPACRVWVNGDEAGVGRALAAGDEVAVLPPVSGG